MVPPSVTWTASYAGAGTGQRTEARTARKRIGLTEPPRGKWRTIRLRRTIRLLVPTRSRRQPSPSARWAALPPLHRGGDRRLGVACVDHLAQVRRTEVERVERQRRR